MGGGGKSWWAVCGCPGVKVNGREGRDDGRGGKECKGKRAGERDLVGVWWDVAGKCNGRRGEDLRFGLLLRQKKRSARLIITCLFAMLILLHRKGHEEANFMAREI